MPDLETQADATEDPIAEIEKFQQEFQGARYQRERADDDDGGKAAAADTTPPDDAEPAKDAAVPDRAPVETPPVQDGTPQVKLYTVPDHEMYGELRGQKVTASQLEEAGLISKVITRDHQEMHNAKLYQELKRDFEEKLEAKAREVQALLTRPNQPEISPTAPKDFGDNIERAYVPVLKKLAESGSFEPDIVEAYPRFVSHVAHQIESMRLVGAGVINAIKETKDWVGMQEATTSRTAGLHTLNERISELASDELYAPLADFEERKAFVLWMASKDNTQPWKKMDIETELTNPANLRGAYAAYRAATAHLRKDQPAPSTPVVRDRARMAAGGGGTSRKAPGPVASVNEFDQLKKELSESRAQAFGR